MEPDLYSTLLMGPLMEHARQRSAGLTVGCPKALEQGLVEGLFRVVTPDGLDCAAMDTFLAIISRREVRTYADRPVPTDVQRRILEAGRMSGSSTNKQQ